MEVRLVVERGNTKKRSYTIQSSETVIGRRQDCDLRIASSEVSRRHCVLTIDDNQLTVKDLDSVNGTFVNGARIKGKRVIRSGDRLEVGPVRFIVKYELTKEALNRLEQTVDARSLQAEPEELPLAEVDELDADFALAEVDQLDELPLAEEDDTEAASEEVDFEVAPLKEEEADDEPIPFVEELEEDPSWKLPQAGELRDILSQMDDKPHKKSEE
jgi:pSer/pThr/pTyr-binding forkhead associated (FHA) protein